MSDSSNPGDPANWSGYADPADAAAYAVPTPGPASAPGTPPAPMPAPAPILATFGEISVTQFHVITPQGTYPLSGTTWHVTDTTTTTQGTPQWAVILAVVGFVFLCLLSLLFLLAKETKYVGAVQVTVQGPGFGHTALLLPGTGHQAHAQVAYVRSLVQALSA